MVDRYPFWSRFESSQPYGGGLAGAGVAERHGDTPTSEVAGTSPGINTVWPANLAISGQVQVRLSHSGGDRERRTWLSAQFAECRDAIMHTEYPGGGRACRSFLFGFVQCDVTWRMMPGDTMGARFADSIVMHWWCDLPPRVRHFVGMIRHAVFVTCLGERSSGEGPWAVVHPSWNDLFPFAYPSGNSG